MDDFDDNEWAEMQEMYINHTSKELKNIKENLDSAAFDSLRTFGHNLKGSGGMYGFNEITSRGAAIESAAMNKNLEDIKSHLDALEVFLKSKL
jgi:HPt (histidine-containing phosphotransfer) domain-containing protein